MDAAGILQILIYVALILALTPLLGGYMAIVYEGRPHFHCLALRGLNTVWSFEPDL